MNSPGSKGSMKGSKFLPVFDDLVIRGEKVSTLAAGFLARDSSSLTLNLIPWSSMITSFEGMNKIAGLS